MVRFLYGEFTPRRVFSFMLFLAFKALLFLIKVTKRVRMHLAGVRDIRWLLV